MPATEESELVNSQLERHRFTAHQLTPDSLPTLLDASNSRLPELLIVDADALPNELEHYLHALDDDCELILFGESAQQQRFSELFARGNAIFLRRPIDSDFLEQLIIDRAKEVACSAAALDHTPDPRLDQFGLLYGSSPAMKRLFRLLRKASSSDATLFVFGESGTGKELVARSVHAYSARSEHNFDGVNCGALPAELVESELFGHEKGSFSGAHKAHAGLFERVGAGTLLLDEVTEMPESAQVALLRVLETGYFRRVGGEQDLRCDARVITACNRDPQRAVEEGVLREDLFYRLNQIPVEVPPLRDREDDALNLARFFIGQFNEDRSMACELTPEAESLIGEYYWPGNVRQLRNAVYSACRVSGGALDAQHLGLGNASEPGVPSEEKASINADNGQYVSLRVGTSLRDVEKIMVLETLRDSDDDKKRAADRLGISVRTLYNRLKEYRTASSPKEQQPLA
ncbi:two component, sigma54 specific, transcriptional regulator, Fis family [Luminiphilus syltensis NOR5-1B]|uniref:Two component, sigma54 specific, transcriptional regulator, Fis family n=1 Tax=Luminiphilus syltensis NOR5-1B TaxID=565045 RepID=B8KTW0_9GAMM|nr:two component, sigma54 specific, transcriptional regulator, Fis family [Luminiphilus syltensis NOR5-1B]